jgi:hypothetical protein
MVIQKMIFFRPPDIGLSLVPKKKSNFFFPADTGLSCCYL